MDMRRMLILLPASLLVAAGQWPSASLAQTKQPEPAVTEKPGAPAAEKKEVEGKILSVDRSGKW